MNEEPYQNREIREMFDDVKATLSRIEEQTTKTNGRVSTLEKWQSYVIGFCAAITVGLFSLVPIVISVLKYLR